MKLILLFLFMFLSPVQANSIEQNVVKMGQDFSTVDLALEEYEVVRDQYDDFNHYLEVNYSDLF